MKPGLKPKIGLGLCRLGLGAGLRALASPCPQKPGPSPGFQAQPGPHITTRNHGLGQYIKNLQLRSTAAERIDLILCARNKLPNLKLLVWDATNTSMSDWSRFSSIPLPPRISAKLPAYFRSLTSLEDLVLRQHHFSSFRYLVQLIFALPKLARLALETVYWNADYSENLSCGLCRPHMLSVMSYNSIDNPPEQTNTLAELLWFFVWSQGRGHSSCRLHSLLQEDAKLVQKVLDVAVEEDFRYVKMKVADKEKNMHTNGTVSILYPLMADLMSSLAIQMHGQSTQSFRGFLWNFAS